MLLFIDFPAVNWVVQFDCPEDANTYIHRVGRTARYYTYRLVVFSHVLILTNLKGAPVDGSVVHFFIIPVQWRLQCWSVFVLCTVPQLQSVMTQFCRCCEFGVYTHLERCCFICATERKK